MIVESPFKFLDSYAKEDREIFFGRDQEVDEVYNKVFQDKTLFVYGESGTGKSSLINCGLANRFKDTDWLPVNVRRGENINDSVISELEKLSLTEVKNTNGSFSKNLFKYTRSVYLDYFKPIYFIFDQFEELYLMGTKSEWKEFITGIKSLADRDLHVHFIFIIRAEYLHFMSEFEEEIPEIFNNKLRIEKITRLKAKECIEGPCKVFGIKVENDFSDLLFDQLSPDRSDIELTYLQVFLDRIYKLAKEDSEEKEQITFNKELLDRNGMVSDVLSDFLDEQIDTLPDKENGITILKAFVTVEGTKRQASIEDILSFGKSLGKQIERPKAEATVHELLECRILKELPDIDKFELRHDSLANKIFEKITTREKELIEVRQFLDYGLVEYKKRGFLLNDRDLAYVQPHLELLELEGDLKDFVDSSLKAVKKRRRTRKRLISVIIIIVALGATALYGFFDADRQREEALIQKQLAEENAEEAENQRVRAEESASLALMNQQRAVQSAEEAQQNAQIADQQRLIANLERISADSSRIETEKQRLIALQQKDSAEAARAQAILFAQQAETQRELALKLSMQSLARSMGIKAAQLPDLELKSLLALQAYKFNNEFEGYAYQSDIYNGLYQAYKQGQREGFNEFKVHSSSVSEIVRYQDSFYSVDKGGKIVKWNSKLTRQSEIANTGMINNSMAVSPDGTSLAVATAQGIVFVYSSSGDQQSQIQAHQGKVWDLIFVNNMTLLTSGEDLKVMEWDLNNNTGKVLFTSNTNLHSLAYHSETSTLWLGSEEGKLKAFNLISGESRQFSLSTNADEVSVLTSNEDENLLAIGFKSGTILLWDVTTNSIVETLPGHTAHVADIAFSFDGHFLVSGGWDGRNFIWNLNHIKEPPISLSDNESFVSAVEVINEKQIISGELNGLVKIYELEMSHYANQMCDQVERNLTSKEWASFIREDIDYRKTCDVITN